MAWQELGAVSTKDIRFDADGYVHFSRTFKVWDVDPYSFFSHLDTITQIGTNVKLPQYGHSVALTLPNGQYGPFLSAGASDAGTGESIKVPAYLHEWQLQPSTPAVFVAIAHYSNDPRLTPNGIHYHATQQQSMVTLPYARRAPVSIGNAGGKFGYMECSIQLPMAVEAISHTVRHPRSQLKVAERNIQERVTQLHQLPIKSNNSPCLYLGADIRMDGPQWLSITHQWQWQQGVWSISFADIINYKGDGTVAPPSNAIYPPKVSPLASNALGTDRYVLPPYHSVEMYFLVEDGGGLAPRWTYRLPQNHESGNLSEWRGLPGAQNFIWGVSP